MNKLILSTFLIGYIAIVMGCSGDIDEPGIDEPEVDCEAGHPYTINGESHCVFRVDGPDQRHCPEGMVVSFALETESESDAGTGEVYVCSTSEELTSFEHRVLDWIASDEPVHGESVCESYGFNTASACGECVCDSCTDDRCAHTICEMEICDSHTTCKDRQCVEQEELAGLTCDNVVERWYSLVADHLDCETVDDCTMVGRSENCDCTPTLGIDSDTAINRDGAPIARAYYDLFNSDECADVRHQNRVCDAGPGENLRCDDGVCRLDEQDCFQ